MLFSIPKMAIVPILSLCVLQVAAEVWKDKDAQAAHASASATQASRASLESFLRSPYDERTHVALNVAPASKTPAPGAVYVVTHIDIFPPSQAAGLEQIRALSDDSRKDDGNIRYAGLHPGCLADCGRRAHAT